MFDVPQMPNYCMCGCRGFVSVKGAYCKGHQPAGTSRDPTGRIKANNDRTNPINNAKVQERAREENEERISKIAVWTVKAVQPKPGGVPAPVA